MPDKEAANVVFLAFEMIKIINRVRVTLDSNNLNMRIGIHTVILFFLIKKKIILNNNL